MTAEYALKAALGPQPLYRVSSAGTQANFQEMVPEVRARLTQRGLDPSAHRQRRVNAQMLTEADVVVAMGLDHRDHLREHFDREAWLFNQICFDTAEPVLDIWEAVPHEQRNPAARQAYIYAVIDHVCEAMPQFIKNAERFCGR